MKLVLVVCLALAGATDAVASGLPVTAAHPRLLLSPAVKAQLQTKVSANDPTWLALKARADVLKTYTIFPYTYATRTEEPANTIFYDYQGEGWYDAAFPLALAYQMTGDTAYSGKLIELAQEMLRAQTDPNNNPPVGLPPLQPDNYYPTRNLGPVLAIVYDWCYDQLSSSLRTQLVALMNAYFDDLRANAYQRDDYADGNYFMGHVKCAAFLGYASYGDNPRAQELIDYARIRLDATPSPLVTDVPATHFDQLFAGGYPAGAKRDYLGPDVTGAPFVSGFDFQSWAYGSGTLTGLIDVLLSVRSATGEDLIAAHRDWFSRILKAERHALMPNRFYIDPSGDWGGNYGATIVESLPIRLASILAGTPDGPYAQHLYYVDIDRTTDRYPEAGTGFAFRAAEWEAFLFDDPSRPSTPFTEPPYYSAFGPAYPQAGATNGAMPYFILRSDFGPDATWASIQMGTQWYDDHQHSNAGHLELARGSDYLLVDAAQWMGASGSTGLYGGCNEADNAASANTLTFDDFGDYQVFSADGQYWGGQGYWGRDQVVAAEQNTAYSYVRSDLSTAYDRAGDPSDEPNRKLDFFYRSFLYLRSSNLFLVYDQVQAKPSTNARGPYRKQIRWHFPTAPAMSGNQVQVDHGASRLYLTALLPASASLTAVDESNNPDPCQPGDTGCTAFPGTQNSGTFRVEVRDPANPLGVPFLTLLQPGPTSLQAAAAANLTTTDGKMVGAVVTPQGGPVQVVFFNALPGAVPPPVTATSYAFSGPASAVHTLCGMVPGATYAATFASGVVSVSQSSSGSYVASAAGVLQISPGGGGSACATSDGTLCLGQSRFRVTVAWRNQYGGGSTGVGTAVQLTPDTGYFWFFASSNVEVVIKVLDGTAVNGRYWVFYGALSDVEYTITVTDTVTNAVKTYYNAPGNLGSVADTNAF